MVVFTGVFLDFALYTSQTPAHANVYSTSVSVRWGARLDTFLHKKAEPSPSREFRCYGRTARIGNVI